MNLADVTATGRAQRLTERTGRDARLCQLYLDEAKAVLNVKGRHVVTVGKRGFLGTGSGVDMSNVGLRSEGWIQHQRLAALLAGQMQLGAEPAP
jgi:F420-0:gamma-glutamyl ligase